MGKFILKNSHILQELIVTFFAESTAAMGLQSTAATSHATNVSSSKSTASARGRLVELLRSESAWNVQ
jgi:hypothetical protein